MDKGTYRRRRWDFCSYAASFFNPYIFAGHIRGQLGCGVSALALLTGIAPELIARKKRDNHCSDKFMVRSLRANGFRVLRLTQCNLSQAGADLATEHVVLIAQLFRENEGTWIVLFNGNCYHNFEVYSLDKLSFLKKPILSAFLVFHPKWRLNNGRKETSPRKILAPSDGITLTALDRSGLGRRKRPRILPRQPLKPQNVSS